MRAQIFTAAFLVTAALAQPTSKTTRQLGCSGDSCNGVTGGALGDQLCKESSIEVFHLPIPGDCTRFVKCGHTSTGEYNGVSTIYTCDPELHFNPVIQTCTLPRFAGCNAEKKDGSN